jgi:hypothetical protein
MFALARLPGFGIGAAYAAQAVLAVCATAAVAVIWRRPVRFRLKAAALMSATLLISPYLFDYDLVWLAFPLAWTALDALEHGWLRWEREVLAAAWLAPLAAPVVATATALQAGPLVTAALLLVIVRRAVHVPASHEGVFR